MHLEIRGVILLSLSPSRRHIWAQKLIKMPSWTWWAFCIQDPSVLEKTFPAAGMVVNFEANKYYVA